MPQTKQSAVRDLEIYNDHMRGSSTAMLARHYDVSPQTVLNAIDRVRKVVAGKMAFKVEEVLQEQVARLGGILTEALDAWELSKKFTRRVNRKSDFTFKAKADIGGVESGVGGVAKPIAKAKGEGKGERGGSITIETVTEEAPGDVRFLNLAREIIADISELHGLRKNGKGLNVSSGGAPVAIQCNFGTDERKDYTVSNEVANQSTLAIEQSNQSTVSNDVTTECTVIDFEEE